MPETPADSASAGDGAARCGVVITTAPDVLAALDGLCDRLLAEIGGAPPDLVLAFYTPHHSGDLPALHARLVERLDPRHLLGCPAVGIIGEDVEVEGQAGIALWGARWPGAELVPFRLSVELDDGDEDPRIVGWPERVPEGAGFLLLVDPYTTPADDLLGTLARDHAGAAVVGGMASGATGPGDAQLMTRDGVHESGCVGLAVGGSIRLDPVVSQGCRPVGHHMVITKAERNVIHALGGQPALARLRSLIEEAGEADRELIQRALHVGRVVDERKSRFGPGDFLVRNVLGINPSNQAIAVSDFVRAGQTIQFMVRDAEAASAELSLLLRQQADRGRPVGAMLFSCNGRGQRFFGRPHHDVRQVREALGEAPTAGFFCAGEIGPVGGQPFLHGFTASIALFRERA